LVRLGRAGRQMSSIISAVLAKWRSPTNRARQVRSGSMP
jgi:hypothetical protein